MSTTAILTMLATATAIWGGLAAAVVNLLRNDRKRG
ncbi:methionine/alanine import family NSS transporter small subunit [Marihabitans asiaticum]|uniref:Putative methionine/alanine importer small subunit n=1 Tax=Marihabitans asiaticum TaxID=415218 RepID=A0A560W8E0_9MICO|nr:methionine/alanine import family NSS transporter small subunit [Marihabitans asiaticum]TWD13902.1 putative methionine/alanine importer small subunit [Marihabitans asiaticum]